MEKHFPAPDRNRIHRLLGLDPPRKSDSGKVNNNGDADVEAAGSSGKRKPGTVKLPLMFCLGGGQEFRTLLRVGESYFLSQSYLNFVKVCHQLNISYS